MKMEVDIERARQVAEEIEKTISKINRSMTQMQVQSKNIIDKGIHTEWAEVLLNNLNKYMDQDLVDAMENMQLSARNIYLAADYALKYSQEKQ